MKPSISEGDPSIGPTFDNGHVWLFCPTIQIRAGIDWRTAQFRWRLLPLQTLFPKSRDICETCERLDRSPNRKPRNAPCKRRFTPVDPPSSC
ncbi:hypothetical protein SAMN05192541_11689 [Bradyrhizobium arachidis]|nr:hypothetical protein SAMN05192541_11689 [Bradyrhizobium arachidis]